MMYHAPPVRIRLQVLAVGAETSIDEVETGKREDLLPPADIYS